jgi:hypothetical protein
MEAGRRRQGAYRSPVEAALRLDARCVLRALGRARGGAAQIVARRDDGLGEPLPIKITPRGGDSDWFQLGIAYTVDSAPIDDVLILMRRPGWGFECRRTGPDGNVCPRHSRSLFLAAGRARFFCVGCSALAYSSQFTKPASRLKPFLRRLIEFERALESTDPRIRASAVRDARRLLRSLVGGVQ